MIAHAQLIPSDVVLRASDHASAVQAAKWIRRYAREAMEAGGDSQVRGSLCAIIGAAETALHALGAGDE